MAENTEISWTDATFNPWMGCTKVSPGCDHCYAENLMDNRHGKVHWGAGQPRVRTGEKNWNLPVRWNARPFYECAGCGWRGEKVSLEGGSFTEGIPSCPVCDDLRVESARRRVFCSSLADVFDNEVAPAWRADLFKLIKATPKLDWLLLTKRIGNVAKMLPPDWFSHREEDDGVRTRCQLNGYHNVWLGATIVNQEEADRDIHKLLAVPARVRFLSMEPLLGPVDLRGAEGCGDCDPCIGGQPAACAVGAVRVFPGIDWVIVGGESGHGARPMSPDWVRSLRDQCAAAGVPFHFKQWGEWAPHDLGQRDTSREPTIPAMHRQMNQVGKKKAGRLLDGATHNAFPEVL